MSKIFRNLFANSFAAAKCTRLADYFDQEMFAILDTVCDVVANANNDSALCVTYYP